MEHQGKLYLLVISSLFIFNLQNISAQSGWIQQESGTTTTLHSVYFANSNTGWISGNFGTILKTTNAGTNWIPQTSNTDLYLVAIYFVNENLGFVSGYWSGNNGIILKTTDGGTVWDTVNISPDYYIASINFINANTGYFVGGLYASGPNKILKTTDAGITFEEQNSTTSGVLYSTRFVNSSVGFSSGVYGSIIKTTNGGTEWFSQSILPVNMLSSITFLDENTGFVVGGNFFSQGFGDASSYIGKTTNGGLNWVTQLDDTGGYFLGQVFFVNQQTGYVSGSPDFTDPSGCTHNKFYKTTNAGDEWTELPTPIVETLTSIYFNDANTGYAVGCAGKILKTTTGGITGINLLSSEIPSGYILEQNYPNPFNPITNLEFGISNLGFVTLKVYDVLGNEVKTLVNENKPAGRYTVTFDGSNLSSGIYFYKLEAGNFSEVKKMTLLK